MSAKKFELLLLIVAFAVFCFLSIAFAQQGGAPGGGSDSDADIIGKWDKDKDGKVSKAEWQRTEKLFKEYDKNNSGYIDSDEKPQMPTTGLMDANGDNKVSKDEFVGPAEFFKQLDANNDGYLVEGENTMKGGAGGGPQGGAPAGGAQGAAPGTGGVQ